MTWLLMFWALPTVVSAWPCPQQGDVNADGKLDRIERQADGIYIKGAEKRWAVPLPLVAIEQVCLGDLDGDRRDEIAVTVVRATPKDQTFRRRLFVFSIEQGQLKSKFLGTRAAGELLDFGLADLNSDKKLEVLVRERVTDKIETRAYAWEGFGLAEVAGLASKVPDYASLAPDKLIPFFGKLAADPAAAHGPPLVWKRRPLKLKKNLANVANLRRYKWLSKTARRRLQKNGFVVVRPATAPAEFHSLYIENQYKSMPSFVTADAALHLTHLLIDFAVAKVEREVLAPALTRLVVAMARQAEQLAGQVPQEMEAALGRVKTRLVIARELLSPSLESRTGEIAEEIKRIEAAKGPVRNPLGIDYPSYKVRGHYTSSEALQRYFRAFLFLSQAGTQDPLEAAVLTSLALVDEKNRKILAGLDKFSAFLAGQSAGPTPLSLQAKALLAFGEKPDWPKLAANKNWIGDLKGLCRTAVMAPGSCAVTLLARRWLAENDILEATVDVDQRPYPNPLDLLAALGSKRAEKLLAPQKKEWPPLAARLGQVVAAVKSGKIGDRLSIAGRWLSALRWVLLPYPKGYASFQRSPAWSDHNLVSAAASWAELRRDVILYVQPPIVWREGGSEEHIPPSKAGYVEPIPELFAELGRLLEDFQKNLNDLGGAGLSAGARNSKSPAPLAIIEHGRELLGFLESAALKEIKGKHLTRAEHRKLSEIGSWFEDILAGRGKLQLEPVPVIADVYYSGEPQSLIKTPLLVATGPVDLIVVAIPLGKRVVLARGAVSSFYSFVHPTVLTDLQWRELLESGRAPMAPDWAEPIRLKPTKRKSMRD
jgi:uncharacterized protein DUF3160